MNVEKGRLGEELGCEYLRSLGFRIICQNYRTKLGEIDIVAEKELKLFFVEVKYRNNMHYGTLRDAITYKKRQHMSQSALLYLKKEKPYTKEFSVSFLGILSTYEGYQFDFIENIYA